MGESKEMKAIPLNEQQEVTDVAAATHVAIFPPWGKGEPTILPLTRNQSEVVSGGELWWWDRNCESPTIRSSVRTIYSPEHQSHYWLTDGVCEYFEDTTIGFAGLAMELRDAPEDMFQVELV